MLNVATLLEDKDEGNEVHTNDDIEFRMLTTNEVNTDGVRNGIETGSAGNVVLWNSSEPLLQTWNTEWMQVTVAITLECTDVVAMCTIDAKASNSDRRRVLQDTHGHDAPFKGLE